MPAKEGCAMEGRYRVRLDELLGDAVVDPAVPRGLLPRLGRFLDPFLALLLTPEQRTHARHYVAGLLSDLDRKNAEGIAYLHDQERQGLQKFLGQADWDHRPLLNMGSQGYRPVRRCVLDEVALVNWKGLGFVPDGPEGWEGFSAYRVGMGLYFEAVVYVLAAPSCPSGSIIPIGDSVLGPGSSGRTTWSRHWCWPRPSRTGWPTWCGGAGRASDRPPGT
jgi:hypothetical protein